MKKIYWLPLIFLAFLTSCKETVDENNIEDQFIITSGYICGWCSRADSIVIVEQSFDYVSFNPCTQEVKKHLIDNPLSSTDWHNLISLLDFDDFRSTKLSSCNVCVDGCDNWVKIETGNKIHKITYGTSKADSIVLDQIMPFISELHSLKDRLIQ